MSRWVSDRRLRGVESLSHGGRRKKPLAGACPEAYARHFASKSWPLRRCGAEFVPEKR